MRKEVKEFVLNCNKCNESKITRRTTNKNISYNEMNKMEFIHIDISGPFPTNKDYKYIICIIDRKTNWFEVIPSKEISSNNICNIVEKEWFMRYGPPKKIITDQGRQFESNQFKLLCNKYNITKVRTTPYNPQSNGKVEILNRYLKQTLRTKSSSYDWLEKLPETCLAMRLKPDIHTKESAFEKLTGTKYTFNLFKKTESYENNTISFENMQCYIKNKSARNFDKKYFGQLKIIR